MHCLTLYAYHFAVQTITMASSLVLDNVAEKTSDSSLIILVNNDGTLTVDPQVLKLVSGTLNLFFMM